jgi:hypothetical protein
MVATDAATDAEWRALRASRPAPLPGALRVTVTAVDFLGPYTWPAAGISASIGVSELVSAGLMRRRDVAFVERRRFSAAAEAERRGERRQRGRPPTGVSHPVDFSVQSVWIPLSTDSASVEVRLVDMQSGQVVQSARSMIDVAPDPLILARAIVREALTLLDDQEPRPAWADPLDASPLDPTANGDGEPRVAPQALSSFLAGLAAEERWNWEAARRGYQAAATDASFHEAATLLARAARLRLGGTLAES